MVTRNPMALYRTGQIPGKGNGAIACSDIAQGTLVNCQSPPRFISPCLARDPRASLGSGFMIR